MADNTNTASSADTSSVTAIKVKVVLDTTTEELKNQFRSVYKELHADHETGAADNK